MINYNSSEFKTFLFQPTTMILWLELCAAGLMCWMAPGGCIS